MLHKRIKGFSELAKIALLFSCWRKTHQARYSKYKPWYFISIYSFNNQYIFFYRKI